MMEWIQQASSFFSSTAQDRPRSTEYTNWSLYIAIRFFLQCGDRESETALQVWSAVYRGQHLISSLFSMETTAGQNAALQISLAVLSQISRVSPVSSTWAGDFKWGNCQTSTPWLFGPEGHCSMSFSRQFSLELQYGRGFVLWPRCHKVLIIS